MRITYTVKIQSLGSVDGEWTGMLKDRNAINENN